MQVEITLKNYRCFSDTEPARFSLAEGFTSFVGVNNSGKSTLLRFFYEFRPLFNRMKDQNWLSGALRSGFTSTDLAPSIRDHTEVFCDRNEHDLEIDFQFPLVSSEKGGQEAPPIERITVTIQRTWLCKVIVGANNQAITIKPEMQVQFPGVNGQQLSQDGRLLLSLGRLHDLVEILINTIYIGPFRNAINVGAKSDYFDIQIGQAFISQWRMLKTGPVRQHNEAAYKLTEDIKSLLGFVDLEINPSPDDQTLQVFVNGKSFTLPELGSGLAQFIVVLANAATKQPSYILIDEPELNLHPSLQLDFLTTLGSYAQYGVLFATHTIGLARASSERIYSVQFTDNGDSKVAELETTPRLSELLGELSYSGYKDLGFDKILLVEGATDIKTLHQFLRLYGKDHQVVLLPLGGSQLINASSELELEEIKRISNNVFALIDSERKAEEEPLGNDRTAFVEICEKVGISCRVLHHRAMENYLTDEAVKKVKGEKYRALQPYELLKEVNPAWGKSENWRIAREMSRDDLDDTDFGEFLNSL